RTSLVYFGQLSDFQLADEESPARVEVIDPLSTPLNLPFGAAWRPWEALEPQIDESMIRQVNKFAGASPGADGSGARRDTGVASETRARRQRRPPGDGLLDRHRRLGRQPAAERDPLGADPARGRQPQPQQRR